MDDEAITPEQKEELQAVLTEFNHFINGHVRQRTLKIYTMADFMASLYLRIRMHMDQRHGLDLMGRIVTTIERQIEAGELKVYIGEDESPMRYHPFEELEADPALRDMIGSVSESLTDDEIDKFLSENEK